MAANSTIASALKETYSIYELKASRKTLLDAALAPDALTGEQLEGVSFQFAPRSLAEISQALENVASAIYQHENTDAPGEVKSRFFNFGSRPME